MHKGIDGAISMKDESLEPDLFEQSVLKDKSAAVSFSLGRNEARAKSHWHNYQQVVEWHCR